jgi:hypothetical protein
MSIFDENYCWYRIRNNENLQSKKLFLYTAFEIDSDQQQRASNPFLPPPSMLEPSLPSSPFSTVKTCNNVINLPQAETAPDVDQHEQELYLFPPEVKNIY